MLQGLGSLLRCQISAIHSRRALLPYKDSCHVNYSAHKLYVNFPAIVATSIVAVPSYSGLKRCIYSTII